MILFEFTVPLLELLPEENFAFILLMTGSLVCFYKTHQKAPLNHVAPNKDFNDPSTAVLISDREDDESEAGRLYNGNNLSFKVLKLINFYCYTF